jgi:hypothetical protein
MEIVGAAVGVAPLFQTTKEYCRPFLTDRAPEFFVEVTQEDLLHEQMLLEREAVEEGLKIRKFPDPFLERSVIQRRVADYLVGKHVLMFHGSTVSVDGRAYLFTAPCGTGKSTHTRLWRELFGSRAIMVNDDKPFLQITSDGVLAYGSPWSGKHGLASNICVPLQGICFLRRGKENAIQPGDAKVLMPFLHQQAHTPEEGQLAENVSMLVEDLVKRVPLWEMECNRELEAARMAFAAMSDEDRRMKNTGI